MKGISSNIKMLSSYNFKDGIEGFSRMVAETLKDGCFYYL